MARYIKETPRITVKFIDADTEQTILEVPDRNHTNIGDIMTAYYGDRIVQDKLKGKKLPRKILVLTVSELILVD